MEDTVDRAPRSEELRTDESRSDDAESALGDYVLVAIIVVAFVLRLGWSLYAARRPAVFGDPFSYLTHGEEIARRDGFRVLSFDEPGGPTAYYPVGYPLILGGAIAIAQRFWSNVNTMGVAIGLNVVTGTATVWFVYDLTRRLARRTTALIAAALTALFPGLVLYTATVHLETVFTFIVVFIAWLMLSRPWTGRPPRLIHLAVLGALFAVAIYVRPIAVVFIPLLALFWKRSGTSWWQGIRCALIVLGVVVLALAPWTYRNSQKFDTVVVLSTNTGDNLCVGHQPQSQGHYHHLADFCWAGMDPEVIGDEVARDRANTRRALRYAISNPVREVELLGRKVWYLLEHDHEAVYAIESYGEDRFLEPGTRTWLMRSADVFYYAVLVLALFGLWPALREGDLRRRILVAWTGVLLFTPLVFFGGARFHVPALPFFAILAALAIGWASRGRDPSSATTRH